MEREEREREPNNVGPIHEKYKFCEKRQRDGNR
jgi:hypothetical protein